MEVKVYIRKSTWTPSKPWIADLEMDGKILHNWLSNFRVKKNLIAEIRAIRPDIKIVA